MISDPYQEACDVGAVEEAVVLLGPGPAALSLSPLAAEETARRLIAAAAIARAYRPNPAKL